MAEKQTEQFNLPEAFLMKMKVLLGEEYEAFLRSYALNAEDICLEDMNDKSFQRNRAEHTQGLRLNPLKAEDWDETVCLAKKAGLRKVPWAREGYYYKKEQRPGRHIFHEAGVYYIQEPSAMAAAELLDPKPGEKVLDLCAAPGGKTTQIAGRLLGQGMLLSNEIHPARARILSQNVERMGVANAVVCNETAEVLAGRFPEFFHKILVDAPCSGEGMFRKDQEARNQWSQENVAMCAKRQKEILDYAASMLCPGGRMVYSTCTFSPEENEGSIQGFLKRHPEFSVEKTEACKEFDRGRPEWIKGGQEELADTFRIWPHKAEGEGHYLAVLKKEGIADLKRKKQKMPDYVKDPQVKAVWRNFAEETFTETGLKLFGKEEEGHLILFGEQLYLVPKEMPDFKGLKILRAGLHLGSLKKNRFEPSHSLALFLKKSHVKRWVSREAESKDMTAYVWGESLQAFQEESCLGNGWTLVLAGKYSVGWAKKTENTLKNHYPRGLRRILESS